MLRSLVPAGACPVLYVDHLAERGVDLFQAVCEQDMEGIVAKRADGLYTPDETSWVKIKNRAYNQNVGRREFFERRRRSLNLRNSIESLKRKHLLSRECLMYSPSYA